MDSAHALRSARRQAGLTQAELARRAGTSQATVSAYESGRKRPVVETFSRLLAVMGLQLAVEPKVSRQVLPSRAQQRRAGRVLVDVLALAELLPTRHDRELRFPRLDARYGWED